MERHHMTMAVSVCTRSDDDASGGVVVQTQTAFDEDRGQTGALHEAGLPASSVSCRTHTLVLEGSLHRGSVDQLEAEIERLCDEGVTGITLDLRELSYIDAIGVAVVAFRCGLCRRRGYDFALIRGSRGVQRAFERAGVSELLPFEELSTIEELVPAVEPVAEQVPPLVLTPRLEAVASSA
jgi:anti-anti-sigma factor